MLYDVANVFPALISYFQMVCNHLQGGGSDLSGAKVLDLLHFQLSAIWAQKALLDHPTPPNALTMCSGMFLHSIVMLPAAPWWYITSLVVGSAISAQIDISNMASHLSWNELK